MNRETKFDEFIKLRLGLVLAVATVICVGTIGLITMLQSASIEAVPLYVHATLGAVLFPLLVFVAEYRGHDEIEAVKMGVGGAAVVVLFVLLMTEGTGKIANGLFELGAATLFFVAAVSLVASTLIVIWLQRNVVETSVRPRAPRARRTDR